MATTSPTLNLITQASSVFLESQPSASELSAWSNLVDQGVESLSQAFIQISQTAERSLGETDELTRLFFILFNRAPDLPTYTAAMSLMASGNYSLVDICNLGLQFNSSILSNSLNLTNLQFMTQLVNIMFDPNFGSPAEPNFDLSTLSVPIQNAAVGLLYNLNNFLMSRAQVLAQVVAYDATNLSYHLKVETALDYLAVTGQPPSQAQMSSAIGISEGPLLNQIMMNSGISPYGSFPYFSISNSTLTLYGNLSSSFSLDLSNDTSSLGSNSNYRLFLTTNGGLSDNSLLFNSSLLAPITNVDASGLASTLASFTFQSGPRGATVQAPNLASSLTGGSGTDILKAGNVKSTLIAGSGNEFLIGGSADDTLYAGSGRTTLTGGAGKDTFIFPPIPSVSAYSGYTEITDFGNGSDVLNLGLMAGNTGATKAATLVVGSADFSKGFVNTASAVNDSVFLIFDTGQWANYPTVSFTARTAQDISNLFFSSPVVTGVVAGTDGLDPVIFTKAPTVGQVYFVIDYNSFNGGADIFYVDNLAPLTTVTADEVKLVGHLDASNGLWQTLNANGSIVL